MKNLKKLSVLAAVLVVAAMFLTSCGGALKDDPAVGNWTMTEVEYAGQTLSAADLKSTGVMNEMPTMEVREDGTCTFTFMEQSGDGEVTPKDGKYEISDDSDQTLMFEIKDGKLRLDYKQMNMVMIFENK